MRLSYFTQLIIVCKETLCKSPFPSSSFSGNSLTLGLQIGTDVIIITLNIALNMSSSKDENRLQSLFASVVVVNISHGFFSMSRDLSTLCSRVSCSSGRFTGSVEMLGLSSSPCVT